MFDKTCSETPESGEINSLPCGMPTSSVSSGSVASVASTKKVSKRGRPRKDVQPPSFDYFPVTGTAEEQKHWLKVKNAAYWQYAKLSGPHGEDYQKKESALFVLLLNFLHFVFLVLVEQLVVTRTGKRKHHPNPRNQGKYNFYLITFFRAFNYSVCQRLKKGKIANVKELKTENSPRNPKLTTDQSACNSLIRCHSSEAHKIMPKDPEQAVRVLFHIYQQFSRCPH